MPVSDQAQHLLADALAHNAGFAVIHAETFFPQNRGHMN